jgi:hypothetical protein
LQNAAPPFVTAATTTSAASSQSTRTGRSLEAPPLVNGMSASQISPAFGIAVKPFVFWRVAIQEGAVVSETERCGGSFGHEPSPVLRHPTRQFLKILRRELLDGPLNFFDCAHGRNLAQREGTRQVAKTPMTANRQKNLIPN